MKWTKEYRKEYDKEYCKKRQASGKKHEERRRYREKMRMFMLGYLADKACVDCGETDPVVLTFDHVRGEKIGDIASMLMRCSMEKVVEEIKKCDIRCGNCHLRKTAKERMNYKTRV